jgi:penicillin-binding protein 1B
MAAKKKARSKSRRRRGRGRRRSRRTRRFPWLRLLITLVVVLVAYGAYLDFQVYRQFEGKRWALPARVYARPLELYAGSALSADQFARELKALGYRSVRSPQSPGEVSRAGERFHLRTRPFRFWDGAEPAQSLWLAFSGHRVQTLSSRQGGAPIALARLDPLQIGAIHPARHEDRVLVKREEVPPLLIETLVAVEDRGFYDHHGISFRGIARALWANLRAGGVVQGGSTLTQQLVKNFFLTSERSLWRKGNEAIMALLLERRYSKEEILEAYLNEVYLAQDGNRAIHGFGLASQFLFGRSLADLSPEQIALLVGMVKGPSYYDPIRHPDRARARRNLVLDLLAEQGVLSEAEAAQVRARPLGVRQGPPAASNRFPAFMELLREQLRRDYEEEDLQSEGLRIFTTLDPQLQWALQESLTGTIQRLEKAQGMEPESLQGAGVVTSVGGEVLALVGDRDPGAAGFNRALAARRPVGSLLKPAVYLTALERPGAYHWASLVSDEPLEVPQPIGEPWAPRNYDEQFHGEVTLYEALVHSYNVATARLGLALGMEAVIANLQRLGVERELDPYPSLLLGATDLTPLEVTALYQTLASGGFRTPLRAIREVLDARDEPLQRYPLEVEAVIAPGPAYLVTYGLQGVVREGTGRGLARFVSPELQVAGKTGTTNDLRDSWFAGFTGDRLAVIWLGRDDNQPMGLSGSAGALPVWGELFRRQPATRLEPLAPEGAVGWQWVEPATGLGASEHCEGAVQWPFLVGSGPEEQAPCATEPARRPLDWLQRLFQ